MSRTPEVECERQHPAFQVEDVGGAGTSTRSVIDYDTHASYRFVER